MLLFLALFLLGCPIWTNRSTPAPTATYTPVPTAVPTATYTPVPTVTPTATPTAAPEFIILPPVQFCEGTGPIASLMQILTAELGRPVTYLPWHYVAMDTEVWILYGLPDEERFFKAVFRVVDGDWTLVETEEIMDKEPQADPGREVER